MSSLRLRIQPLLALLLLMAIALPAQPQIFVAAAFAADKDKAGTEKAKEGKHKLKVGEACKRKTDAIPGKVKRDACGRWYCGRADVKDISEIAPNLDKVAHCTWRLEGSRCLCAKTGSSR